MTQFCLPVTLEKSIPLLVSKLEGILAGFRPGGVGRGSFLVEWGASLEKSIVATVGVKEVEWAIEGERAGMGG